MKICKKIPGLSVLLSAFLFSTGNTAFAQTAKEEIFETPEKAGGVYYAYPVTESLNTAPPKGYKPFYISHYSRHGSRYLLSDSDYKRNVDMMRQARDANALTELGNDVCGRLERVWELVEGHGGDLSTVGQRQHQGIARRMYRAFPEVFDGAFVFARSTTVMRCAISMSSFCLALQACDPSIEINMEAGRRNMEYLNYSSKESDDFFLKANHLDSVYRAFEREKIHGERLVSALFSDSAYVAENVNARALMTGLFSVAMDVQDFDADVDFMDLFEKEELFDIWQVYNFNFYSHDSAYPYSYGLKIADSKKTLQEMLDCADAVISSGGNGADLRFGHDRNIISLSALMTMENCCNSEADPHELYRSFADFRIAPMAANIQMIFFRDGDSDVIMKFMLNEREIAINLETDIFPFYHWTDVRAYWERILRE